MRFLFVGLVVIVLVGVPILLGIFPRALILLICTFHVMAFNIMMLFEFVLFVLYVAVFVSQPFIVEMHGTFDPFNKTHGVHLTGRWLGQPF